MLHTRTAIEYRAGTGATILPTTVAVDRFADESSEQRTRLARERAVDEVLADSFPASDPPSWNPGIVRPAPRVDVQPHAERSEAIADTGAWTGASDIIDVSQMSSADRTFLQGVASLAGAAGIVLLVPFAILLIGLPIALSVRGALELFGWFFGVNIR